MAEGSSPDEKLFLGSLRASRAIKNSLGFLIRKLPLLHFLIARLARSDPRNHFVLNFLSAVCSNFWVFHHVFISCHDMFENCINSYHIDSEQVQTCLRIIWIITICIILNLNKFKQVWTCSDMFNNHINSYHIESERV